jgi:hypothetical protein
LPCGCGLPRRAAADPHRRAAVVTAFAVGRPVATEAPRIAVDAGLEPGRHRFSLVVVAAAGVPQPPGGSVPRVTPAEPADRSHQP